MTDSRYFNLAVITTDGRTRSMQVWADRLIEAESQLAKWAAEGHASRDMQDAWNPQILVGTIYDTRKRQLACYSVADGVVRPVASLSEVR